MNRRQILKNIAATLSQTLILGVTLFLLYRYILDVIGPEKLGIWSLVLSSTSITKIANLGLSGSVVKFVAQYSARNNLKAVSHLLQTSLLAIGGFTGLLLLIIYPFTPNLLSFFIQSEISLADARLVLPYSFVSVWLSILFGVILGGLDGFQRIDIRSGIMIASSLFHAILSFILVGQVGLVGLAQAQLYQYLFVIAVGLYFLKRQVDIPIIPYQWDTPLFKELLVYGVNFQVMSVAAMLFDPVTKGLLSRFGGVSMLGYYELANRLVIQVRSLIVSTNQVLVPTIADLKEKAPAEIRKIYDVSMRAVFFISVPVFTFLIVCAPQISELWLGTPEPVFILATRLLSIGWFVNTLSGPIFFIYLGTGDLFWNTVGQCLIGSLNLLLGWVFGQIFGGYGVITGWVLGLIIGSSFVMIAYWVQNEGSFRLFLNRSNLLLTLCATISIVVALTRVFGWGASNSPFTQLVWGISLIGIFLIPSLWLHPMRQTIQITLLRMFGHPAETAR